MVSRSHLIAIALTMVCFSAAAQDQEIDPAKLATIKELMKITGASSNSQQFSDAFSQQFVSVLKLGNPQISDRAISIVEEEVSKLVEEEFAGESLQRLIYLIYARYFTLEDLNGLVAFNRSPVGTKANRVMPQLMEDSLDAAQIWSQEITPKISARVLKRLEEEGIKVRARSSPGQ